MAPIDFDSGLEALTNASPTLASEAERVRGEWAPDVVPKTTIMGVLGTRIVHGLDEISDDELDRIASTLEDLLERGSEDLATAVTTGLLEAAISAAASKPGAARFFQRLGQQARDYCHAWDEFTGARTPGLGDR